MKQARIAGAFYLVTFVTGAFALFVRGKLGVEHLHVLALGALQPRYKFGLADLAGWIEHFMNGSGKERGKKIASYFSQLKKEKFYRSFETLFEL